MSDFDDNSDEQWNDFAGDKTRIQPPKSTPEKPAPADDLIGHGDDATAYKKPSEEGQRDLKRENARTQVAQNSRAERSAAPKTAARKGLGPNDSTKAAASAKPRGHRKSRLQSEDILKNRFVLGRVLGAGGMGVVYKAKDLLKVEAKDRDPFVAIKVLGEEFKSHPEAFIALQRESRKTQKIAHPNIVNVYDFDKDGDTVFMTMEFLDGAPLDKLIKKYKNSQIPRELTWAALEGICSALAYAHEQNIIHADLKPGNIFVTNNNISKVFDFGIARAVAKAEHLDGTEGEDKTMFDAGNLGALTPAYASLEMLEGKAPDIRDDVYALGCIAYEMLAGKHPFQRKNALEAKTKGMKPERITSISKHQWRAIEAALAFDREDRIANASEFWRQLSTEVVTPYKTWFAAFVASVLIGLFSYQTLLKEEPPQAPTFSVEDVVSEAELKIRIEYAEQTLSELLSDPVFDERWEQELSQAISGLSKLVGEDDTRVMQVVSQAYQLYLEQIQSEVDAKLYDRARVHITNARRYTSQGLELGEFETAIANAIEEEERLRLEQERLAKAQKVQDRKQQEIKQEEERRRKAYNIALANINEQLKCTRSLNMDNFGIAVEELRKIDGGFYKKSEPNIISGLVSCIQQIGRNFPPRAERAREAALEIFNNHRSFKNLTISAKDPCREGLAGQGARGKRSICRDIMKSGGRGPSLIIIPANGNVPVFALGKYEISVSEMNAYCKASGDCQPINAPSVLPVTGVSASQAKGFLRWMSDQTGKTYRLPTIQEWVFAAKAKDRSLHSNRNCMLNSRGIQKGGALVNAEVGQQNSWGVVNHIGNAMEWTTGNGQQLYLTGGSYNTQMDQCTPDWRRSSADEPNREAGFRVLREMK